MKDLIHKINEYEAISQSLEIPIDDRGLLLDKVKQFTNDFIEDLPEG